VWKNGERGEIRGECNLLRNEAGLKKTEKRVVHPLTKPQHLLCLPCLAGVTGRDDASQIYSAPSHCTPCYREIPPSAVTPHSPSMPLQQGMLL
jgi:hypothetical protein